MICGLGALTFPELLYFFLPLEVVWDNSMLGVYSRFHSFALSPAVIN